MFSAQGSIKPKQYLAARGVLAAAAPILAACREGKGEQWLPFAAVMRRPRLDKGARTVTLAGGHLCFNTAAAQVAELWAIAC